MKAIDVILAFIPLSPSLITFWLIEKESVLQNLQLIILIAIFGYFLTVVSIPVVSTYTQKAGLFGKDLGKKGTPDETKDV